ncbi:MAG: DMT family transporter [Syntrophobacteraceae bacterium]
MKLNAVVFPEVSSIVWMLLSALCFASMGALSHEVAAFSDWLGVVFARAFSNFLFVAALAIVTSKPLIIFSAPKNLWVRSITGTLSMFGVFYAFTHLPIAEAISIANTTPIWMALLVSVITRESLSLFIWAGVACSTVGVVLVQQPQFQEANVAILAGLGGALFGAIAVYNLHLVKKIHPTTIVAHFSLIASIASFIAMVLSFYVAPRETIWTGEIFFGLIGVGVLGTLGQLTMTRGYMVGSPAVNAIVAVAQVAFGVGLDILILNRSFDIASIIGIILITSPTVFFVVERRFASDRKSIPAMVNRP